jgi:hypothetical protein
MKIEAYINPQGIPRERERAAYHPVFLTDDEQRLFIGLFPKAEGLTCLELVRVFSLALKPGTDREEARFMAQWLFDHLEGLDAVYDPERGPKPTHPNVVPLRAA